MDLIRKRVALLGLLVVLISARGLAQTEAPKNLTAILNELAAARGVMISFSPNLTNGLYPADVPAKGEVSDILQKHLVGHDLGFKCMKGNLYYIYEVPRKVVSKPRPAVVRQEVRDTVAAEPQVVEPEPEPVAKVPCPEKLPLALKSNLLYAATTTLNLGVEWGVAPGRTMDISAGYNGWAFSDRRFIKHFLIQPELRYWTTGKAFQGSFIGAHAHYGIYDISRVLGMDYRYKGWLLGAGITYGMYWNIGGAWRIETAVGIGYTYLNRDKYEADKKGAKIYGNRSGHYIGPDKLSVSLVYLLK